MTVPVKQQTGGDIIEAVIAKNDLSKLTAEERNRYYVEVCRSVGLNPLTQPLAYIPLNGKLTLYAKRDCADQLRKLHGISIEIISQETNDGLLTVHVRAKDAFGRQDEDLGVVAFPDTLRGEVRANAILKAVTKAKRRVTLSISGLGFLDETEVEDIPAAAKRPLPPAPNVLLHEPPHDPSGSQESAAEPAVPAASSAAASPPGTAGTPSLAVMAREAAMNGGVEAVRELYAKQPPEGKRILTLMKRELEALYPKEDSIDEALNQY